MRYVVVRRLSAPTLQVDAHPRLGNEGGRFALDLVTDLSASCRIAPPTRGGETWNQVTTIRAPTHIPIDRGFCATDVYRLVIERQEFGILRQAA